MKKDFFNKLVTLKKDINISIENKVREILNNKEATHIIMFNDFGVMVHDDGMWCEYLLYVSINSYGEIILRSDKDCEYDLNDIDYELELACLAEVADSLIGNDFSIIEAEK